MAAADTGGQVGAWEGVSPLPAAPLPKSATWPGSGPTA